MTLPLARTLRPDKRRTNALDYQIAQEQAAALGRLGLALEAALAALASHDSAAAGKREACAPHGLRGSSARGKLIADASYALWCLIIQREVCGLRDQRQVARDYGVPGEVWNRMGVVERR